MMTKSVSFPISTCTLIYYSDGYMDSISELYFWLRMFLLNNLFMVPPLQEGFSLVVNLLTTPYLNRFLFCVPNFLESQEANFIDNHLIGVIILSFLGTP